jgi:NhaP-type Na+/H+ or K+/H+ antiporter
MAAKWVRVPYTLMLVIVGLIITPMHFLPPVHISPDLILLIFLPALLFDAAWNLRLDHLRDNLIPILTLAVIGVSLSVFVIGAVLRFTAGMPWQDSLLFGAMISATDPVSVLAIFKKLGLPHRLTTILEGESLFNDGTAVVVFRIVLGIGVFAHRNGDGASEAVEKHSFDRMGRARDPDCASDSYLRTDTADKPLHGCGASSLATHTVLGRSARIAVNCACIELACHAC